MIFLVNDYVVKTGINFRLIIQILNKDVLDEKNNQFIEKNKMHVASCQISPGKKKKKKKVM